jgi:hypothetical protein
VTPSTSIWVRYFAAGIAALVFLTASAGLVWWLARPNVTTTLTRPSRLTADSGLTTDPVLSPDGKLIAYASDRGGEGNLDIWRQQLATGEAIRLTKDAADDPNLRSRPTAAKSPFAPSAMGEESTLSPHSAVRRG